MTLRRESTEEKDQLQLSSVGNKMNMRKGAGSRLPGLSKRNEGRISEQRLTAEWILPRWRLHGKGHWECSRHVTKFCSVKELA